MNDRADFYIRIAGRHLLPRWEVLDDLVPPQPRPLARAAFWRYDDEAQRTLRMPVRRRHFAGKNELQPRVKRRRRWVC